MVIDLIGFNSRVESFEFVAKACLLRTVAMVHVFTSDVQSIPLRNIPVNLVFLIKPSLGNWLSFSHLSQGFIVRIIFICQSLLRTISLLLTLLEVPPSFPLKVVSHLGFVQIAFKNFKYLSESKINTFSQKFL